LVSIEIRFVRGREKADSKPSRLISAGKDKPRGGAKKSYRPERSKLRFVRGREKADSKPSRPISAEKDKPRGGGKRAIGPKGQN
jgi:hypothetical protein